jgi:hypothetical protein
MLASGTFASASCKPLPAPVPRRAMHGGLTSVRDRLPRTEVVSTAPRMDEREARNTGELAGSRLAQLFGLIDQIAMAASKVDGDAIWHEVHPI